MTDNSKPLSIIKKYRISIIAILAFAVAFGCVLAFAGSKGEDEMSSIEVVSSEEAYVSEDVKLKGEGIYIDGCFVAAVASVEEAENALNEVLNARVSDLGISSDAENSFNNKIEIISGEYDDVMFTDSKGVTARLGKLNAFDISPKVTDYEGKILPVKLSVRSVVTYSETVVIEHETKVIYTDSMRDGVKNVLSQGYDGEGEKTYQVVSIDGVETQKETVSLNVTVEPTNEVVRVGTRSYGFSTATIGTFIKPFDGIVTSYAGPRWGRNHAGLDIATADCFGKPIVAASDGMVIRASEYGGYGYCVIIDHGNGVKTLYAHMSAFSVQVGDTVVAGDEIGKIGNTGDSLGPHLHFEVRVNDEIVNPLLFVDYD
ncbi:MAG: peptidoglycan DD-metalloendopeptidase family protein [Clostridia bacterium]|nr:peptidoglycan DD-metalloendopeptidase family protein [Clostridia bacterium]